LLANASGPRWFFAAWVQWFWVGFDVLVCVGLLALSARWRRWLALLLLGLVGADALATLLEAAEFVLTRRPSPFECAVVVVALAGPLLASVVLYNARRRALRAAGA